VIDQNWVNTSTPTPTSTDRFQYAYDRDGNRLYQADLVDAALSELYHASSTQSGDDSTAYDALGRPTGFAQGCPPTRNPCLKNRRIDRSNCRLLSIAGKPQSPYRLGGVAGE
jgi:hypothetical protein